MLFLCPGSLRVLTWRGTRKGPGLSKAQKGHFCYSVYVTRWSLFGGSFFLEKEGPSELNKFMHSRFVIFPFFFVILVSLSFSFLFVFSFLCPGPLRVWPGSINTIGSRIHQNAVPWSGKIHFMQVDFRSWNFGAVGRSMVFEERIRNQNLFPLLWLTKNLTW